MTGHMAIFADRTEAGFLLAEQLTQEDIPLSKSVVCGITRGGVVVASIVANILGILLVPLVVKKISMPQSDELAIGAIAPGDIVYWDQNMVREYELTKQELALLLKNTETAFKKRAEVMKKFTGLTKVKGRTVILIDDGVATGATVKAASLSLRMHGAKNIILAVPVIAEVVYSELLPVFTSITALSIAEDFGAVGEFYTTFDQVSDEDVLKILRN